MDKNNLERVKADVEIIKEAAGLKLPFGPKDIRANIIFIVAGILLVLLSPLLDKLRPFWFLIILPVLSIVLMFILGILYPDTITPKEGKNCCQGSFVLRWSRFAVLFLLFFNFGLWMDKFSISGHALGVMVIWLIGMMVALLSFSKNSQISSLGFAVPLLFIAAIGMIWQVSLYVLIGIALALGGVDGWIIQKYQLKENEIK